MAEEAPTAPVLLCDLCGAQGAQSYMLFYANERAHDPKWVGPHNLCVTHRDVYESAGNTPRLEA